MREKTKRRDFRVLMMWIAGISYKEAETEIWRAARV